MYHLVFGIIVAAVFTGFIGVLIGFPALRLHGVYLAIATLGFGEVIRVLFINWEAFNKRCYWDSVVSPILDEKF